MKRVLVVVLAFALLLTGCATNLRLTKGPGTVPSISSSEKSLFDMDGSQSETIAENGFIFKYGIEGKNVLNTFEGTFTKDLISKGTITVPLKLTDQELSTVYFQLKAMNIMDYPDTFDEGYSIPYLTYDLTVRMDGKTKKIKWDEGFGGLSKSKEAERLKELVNSTSKMVENKEEYKRLPPAVGGYD
ncbi:hypothetical protein [Desulfitobacterium metallireducens]|uniref:DUF4825 domain-containing protein n=1 Tax=Desulfitobacterium metallireducens DSM 15288 TaxID=871968 RepID=W0EH77_9FIRM|nr:hypothetical protein [Desulfitobacterium metallireducens]AHF08421.1 hypothetical protein DESME_02325 [Desulfitobacterium metallireducens DSM 15288]